MNILHLTLKETPYFLTAQGLKTIEYRKPSQWIKSRLIGKEYDVVKFVNGYGNDRPYMIFEYKGYEIAQEKRTISFPPSSFKVEVEPGDYMIHLGKLVEMKVRL